MNSNTWCRRLVLTLSAALGTVAYAQGTSVLLGTVTDAASGKKLSDVVVTATSTVIQAPQVTVTDSAGYYRLPGLPPGRYTLRIEKEGYRPYSRSDLEVSLDRQYRVNIAAQPESMSSEEITIAGLPPVIDIGSVNQGAVVNSKFLERMPTVTQGPTNFTAAAQVAPQASTDFAGVSFSGATSPENAYIVDGVSVRNNLTGFNSGVVPVGFIDQTNVLSGGFQAEVGRATGGAIRAVTRSGSNEFHGETWINYIPGALSPPPKVIHSSSSAFVNQNLLWNSVDVNATLGGPILKDRIWFFIGFNPGRVRTQNRQWLQAFNLNAAGTDYILENGLRQYTNIEGSRRTRFQDNLSLPYIAKLTFLLAPNHTLTLTTNGTYDSASVDRFLAPRGPEDGLTWNGGFTNFRQNSNLLLQYQGSFLDKKLLAQAQVSWYRSSAWTEYSDGSTLENGGPGTATGTPVILASYRNSTQLLGYNDLNWLSRYYDATTRARIAAACQASVVGTRRTERCPIAAGGPLTLGGAATIQNTLNDTVQASVSLTYLLQFLGHHVWKAGVDYEWLRNQINKGFSGSMVYNENAVDTYAYRNYAYLSGPDQLNLVRYMISTSTSHQIAWYLQDSWSIMDKVTLNAGVRFDNQQTLKQDGTIGITLNNQVAPRLSLIWDPTQQGRSKIYASYATYFESVPLVMADRQLNGESSAGTLSRVRKSAGCDPVKNFASFYTSCIGGSNPQMRTTGGETDLSKYYYVPGTASTPVDPNLKPQSTDEVTAGVEYEIFRDARLGASYTRRWVNYVVEDLSIDEGNTYFISNPGYGLASNFPKAVRNYNAVTAVFSKAYSSGWYTQASYTWMNLTGNYEGLILSSNGQSDANITGAFDVRGLLVNANGRLPGNQAHTIKLWGGKDFDIGKRFSLGIYLSYNANSGRPINYLGYHPLYGANTAYGLPMGSGGDTPWLHQLDAAIVANVKLAGGMNLQVRIDALNFINLQGVTGINSTFSTNSATSILPLSVPRGVNPQIAACIAGINRPECSADSIPFKKLDGTDFLRKDMNPSFKTPTGYQTPFTAKFSIRFTF